MPNIKDQQIFLYETMLKTANELILRCEQANDYEKILQYEEKAKYAREKLEVLHSKGTCTK